MMRNVTVVLVAVATLCAGTAWAGDVGTAGRAGPWYYLDGELVVTVNRGEPTPVPPGSTLHGWIQRSYTHPCDGEPHAHLGTWSVRMLYADRSWVSDYLASGTYDIPCGPDVMTIAIETDFQVPVHLPLGADVMILFSVGSPAGTWLPYRHILIGYPGGLVPVDIDIKPGDDTNTINNDGHGVIPVAILGSADFDVTQIDVATVALAGMAVRAVGKADKYLASIEDVDADGIDDLVVKIEDTDGAFTEGTAEATLTGNLLEAYGGTPFQGTDSITIVP